MNQSIAAKLVGAEYDVFDNFFTTILTDITSITTDLEQEPLSVAKNWLERVCHFNVPHGKKIRGLLVPIFVRSLVKCPSTEKMTQAYTLGWCVEILQASSLIADDVMDKSKLRRGKPCWYLVDDLGTDAVNDSFLLEHIMYQLIRKHFKTTSYYTDILDIFLQITHKTILGQCLDIQTGRNMRFEEYTMERYEAIVKYKTSFYTFYLPIAIAATISNVQNTKLMNILETLAISIGHLFQILDDYLDCYGSKTKTGKIGTDIQNGKCSWLFVRAKELCSKKQLAELCYNYGHDDEAKIAHVVEIYEAVKIPAHVSEFMKHMKASNLRLIHKLENEDLIILFKQLLEMVTEGLN
ncbi:unnamed protein product [Orchesella dallaii]|uniref:Farnesyl pyrophosphate synthase n=1 Tax=Orchesella dallaii TaxID=48710 RepID=A0ABP1RQW5_9HEXA